MLDKASTDTQIHLGARDDGRAGRAPLCYRRRVRPGLESSFDGCGDCASDDDEARLEPDLLQALSAFDVVRHGEPKRYWKMPELVEFSFAAAGTDKFADIAALCGSGWTLDGDDDDPSWVWNAEPGATFLHAEVVWAEVLTFDA